MSFTTSCYIRINTPELCAKLYELGYEKDFNHKPEGYNLAAYMDYNGIARPVYRAWENYTDDEHLEEAINCGTNEELFLALAALRDDTGRGQWFRKGEVYIKCPIDKEFDEFMENPDDWEKMNVDDIVLFGFNFNVETTKQNFKLK